MAAIVSKQGKSPSSYKSPRDMSSLWLKTQGSYKCGHSRCVVCIYMWKTISSGNPSGITLIARVTIIDYTICHLSFVGCTISQLKKRIMEQIYDCFGSGSVRSSGTAKRFSTVYRGDILSFRFHGIERVKKTEMGGDKVFWLWRLNTQFPTGLH